MPCSSVLILENRMFRKLILFHSKITQYKKALWTKSDNAKIFKEEKEREKKNLVKDYV